MASTQANRSATEQYYSDYEARKGPERNDLIRNPQVLFQLLAAEASVISAFASIRPDPAQAKVLDVGCGAGFSLLPLLRLGFTPSNLYGVDIRREQIRSACSRFPTMNFQCADASQLDFPDDMFDIVQESTIFLQMTDDDLSERIAGEMVRVTKPGGHIVLSDWRYSRPGSSEFKAVDKKRIARLFCVGKHTIVRGVFPGPLVPPIGRFLSKNMPSLYFIVRAVFPFLTGQVATVLTKRLNRT